MASTSEPVDPWEDARRRYLEGLTEEEAELFADASLENLYEAASVSYEAHKRSSKIRAVGKKMQPLLEAIGDYQGALDVLANTSSLFLCPIWGSVRVLLQIASDFGKYFERLADMFMSIGDILPRARTYQSLFPLHEPLRMALSELYLDVMKFCTDAKNIFKDANSSSVVVKMTSSVIGKPLKRRFEKAQSDFRMHRKRVEKQAVVSKCIEDARHNELQRAAVELAEKRRQEDDRMRLLNLLSTIPFEEHHQKLRKKRHKQTGSWLRDADQFKAWIQSPVSAGLYCDGTPGTGKSVLASGVVDDLLRRDYDQKVLVLYYYCDHSDHRTLVPINLVGTLIKQGLIKISTCQDVEDRLNQIYLQGLRAPELGELIEVLLLMLGFFDEVFLVVDGLNECDSGAQADILSLIRNLVEFQTRPIRVFVFSCDEILISKKLEDFVRLPLSKGKTQPVITLLVKETVRAKLVSGELVIRDSSLEDLIVSELVGKAHGMSVPPDRQISSSSHHARFLWVSFQLDDLCEAGSDDAIRKTLIELPDGLTETYSRILSRIAKSSLKLAMAQEVFKWTICARRPLKIAEMKEATAFGPLDLCWDESKIPTDGRRLVQSCHNLAVIDEDDTVRLAHHSVQQFLLSQKLQLSNPQFSLEMDSIQLNAGETCVAYLLFSDFERQVTKVGQSPGTMQTWNIQAHQMALLPTLMASRTVVFRLWYRLLGGKSEERTIEIDYSKYLKPKIQPSADLQAKYRLLSYVIDCWEWHTIQFRDDNTSMWGAFRSLATDRTLPFEVQSWGGNQGPSDLPYLALFLWAIQRGHEGFLTLLLDPPRGLPLEKYYDFEVKRGGNPLLSAVGNGHSSILEFLVRRVNVRNLDPSLLVRAVVNVDEEISLRLLENGADANGQDELKNTPLHYAASNSSRGIVQLLLDHGASINAVTGGPLQPKTELRQKSSNPLADKSTTERSHDSYTACESPFMNFPTIPKPDEPAERLPIEDEPNLNDFRPQTALQLATRRQDVDIVKILLDAGANCESGHGSESPALHLAVDAQNETIATLLLERGANADTRGKFGETALHIASRLGNDKICTLLRAPEHAVNAIDVKGRTALFIAVWNSHEKVVRWLCLQGADLNQRCTVDRYSPLHLAVLSGKERILTMLIDAGANLELRDGNGRTALHLSTTSSGHDPRLWGARLSPASNDNGIACGILLDAKADCEAKDSNGQTALHVAVGSGNIAAVDQLLKHEASPYDKDNKGRTALHIAVGSRNIAAVDLLLKHGASHILRDSKGNTPLHISVSGSDEITASRLLKAGAEVDGKNRSGMTCLETAITASRENMVNLLLDAKPDLLDEGKEGYLLLKSALERGQSGTARHLLGRAKMNRRMLVMMNDALLQAFKAKNEDMIDLLLNQGANPNAADGSGKTLLRMAVEGKQDSILQMLLRAGATANLKPSKSLDILSTPAGAAVALHRTDMLRSLLDAGTDINRYYNQRQTLLHLVAERSNVEAAEILLQRGADANCTDRYRLTPLHVAAAARNATSGMCKVLLDYGAKTSVKSVYGDNPLHLAATRGDLRKVQVLCGRCSRATAEEQDYAGMTAAQLARRRGHDQVAQLILELAREGDDGQVSTLIPDRTQGRARVVPEESLDEDIPQEWYYDPKSSGYEGSGYEGSGYARYGARYEGSGYE